MTNLQQFEDATDVSGFPERFSFVLDQEDLTWDHREPTPAYANVPVPHLDGLANVYGTKNKATGMPLSVIVDTKENCLHVHETQGLRRFIFRKDVSCHEFAKTSRSRKRPLQ